MKLGIAGGRPVAVVNDELFELNGATSFDTQAGLSTLLGDLSRLSIGAKIEESLDFDAPLPNPSQIFAVGLNYRRHAHEMNLQLPTRPMIFTKFPSCVGAPNTQIEIPGATTDWEAELVVVVGRTGRNIAVEDAAKYVAGYMVGQDISERTMQMANNPAQFSLGKSYENFAPMGPYITTADEIPNPQDLTIRCSLNGEVMQNESTADMAFGVFEIVSYISQVCEIRTGDVIFTGSPAGVGQGLHPPRFLGAGDVLITSIDGLGQIHNACVGGLV
jgi:2-keto-4-pentenoate hydratase/2-oxohepta-3-ene-1,7-dioic acid hydratase in catechol pathway